MGRKNKHGDEYTIQQISKALACITDKRKKNWDDLWNVAYQWCGKNYAYVKQVCDDWEVEPMYLLLAALLYVEHPLLVGEGRSWKYSLVMMQAVIIQTELQRADIGIPVKSTDKTHSLVDKTPQPVERMG